MSDEGGAVITQDSWSGRDLAGAGPEVTGPNTSKMVLIMPQRTTARIFQAQIN